LIEGDEPRGTTYELLSTLGGTIKKEGATESESSNERRMESALVIRLQKESRGESPDDVVVGSITVALMRRSLIPSSEHIELARVLLGSDHSPVIRGAAASLLLPDLSGKEACCARRFGESVFLAAKKRIRKHATNVTAPAKTASPRLWSGP
jgi:hypothetical protein